MKRTDTGHKPRTAAKPDKILLTVLPYWAPVLPPVGLTRLKSYLKPRGYEVRIVDLIVKNETLEFYYGYFDVLKQCVPEEKRGNFKNIGHDVMHNHMMAHLHYTDEKEYVELVKILVYKTYYVTIDDSHVRELNKVVAVYYEVLEEYLRYVIDFEEPAVVGATVYKHTLAPTMFLMKFVKKHYPHIKTVIGGGLFADTHVVGTPNYNTLLEITQDTVDKFIIGEGEILFYKYLQGELPPDQRVYTAADIDGEVLDLKGVGVPDLKDLNIRKYSHLPATASFSCKYKCSFCNDVVFRGKYRTRDIGEAVDELEVLHGAVELNNIISGHQLFFLTDSLINPILGGLADELIARDVSLYYDGYYKVDKASTAAENTLRWRKSGLYRVRLGVESGSPKMLKMMQKGITPDQIRKSVSNFAMAGIKTTTYWVIGHPGETEEDFQMTLDLVEELKKDIYQAECNPFLYTYAGQNSADAWKDKRMLLYPENARDMLVFDSWTLDLDPLREVAYERMQRFVNHCKKLGIPNPYTLKETFDADRRWKKLHKFAVPPMDEFDAKASLVRDNVEERLFAQSKDRDDGDFEF